jgi:hypothetical protein
MFEDHGTTESRQGAAAQARYSKKSPLELMVRLIESDPTASRDRIIAKWIDEAKEEGGYEEAVWIYAATNYFNNAIHSRRGPVPTATREQQATRVKTSVAAITRQLAEKFLTLEFIMPNGHRLADCTGTEVAKLGGIFTLIGKKAGKRLVSQAFTEDQLQALTDKRKWAHD